MQANNVQIIGKLGMNPEVKATTTGKKVARFSLAHVSYTTAADGGKLSNVHWFNMVAWEKQADVVEQYLQKGRKVGVSGRLMQRQWVDKLGQKRTNTEIVVNDIVLMDEAA
jgi:single-strand DNA-binding protein